MSDTPNHDDHWRRLAADLGLDVGPEPERAAPPAAEEAPRHEPAAETAAEPEAAVDAEPAAAGRGGRRRRSSPSAETSERPFGEGLEPSESDEPPPPRGRRSRGGPVEDQGHRPPPEPDWAAVHAAIQAEEAEIEGADVEAAAVPEVRPDEAEEAGDEIAEEKTGKRRRRRRSRRKKGAAPPPGGEAGTEVAQPATAEAEPADDDDDAPNEDIGRQWDVPSWDDLIASLHRPER